jgi:DNA-binding response OmpR family regulator
MVKSEEGLKKIFYVEKGEFLRSMMEFALKAKGASIYTVDTLENNFYLLDDLLPDLIIFDVKTVKNQLEELRTYGGKAILVATGDEEDRPLVEGMAKAFLPKPLEAKNIAARILALLD